MKPVPILLSRLPNAKEKESLSLIELVMSQDGNLLIGIIHLSLMFVKDTCWILFYLEEESSTWESMHFVPHTIL